MPARQKEKGEEGRKVCLYTSQHEKSSYDWAFQELKTLQGSWRYQHIQVAK